MTIRKPVAVGLLSGLAVAAVVVAACLPPISQDPSYHHFADQRPLLGVPHLLNVASNVPFAVVGGLGLWRLRRIGFRDTRERWPYAVFFAGVALTCVGSSYYHLEPNNARLVWDRLPIALAFMGLFAAMIAERVSVRAGLWLLPVLLALGAGSVGYWYQFDDLRFYGVVQFYPIVAIPLLLLLFPPRYTRGGDVLEAVGWYLLAKGFEHFDKEVFTVVRLVSGHTLKHLCAAMAAFWILRMLESRRPN